MRPVAAPFFGSGAWRFGPLWLSFAWFGVYMVLFPNSYHFLPERLAMSMIMIA